MRERTLDTETTDKTNKLNVFKHIFLGLLFISSVGSIIFLNLFTEQRSEIKSVYYQVEFYEYITAERCSDDSSIPDCDDIRTNGVCRRTELCEYECDPYGGGCMETKYSLYDRVNHTCYDYYNPYKGNFKACDYDSSDIWYQYLDYTIDADVYEVVYPMTMTFLVIISILIMYYYIYLLRSCKSKSTNEYEHHSTEMTTPV